MPYYGSLMATFEHPLQLYRLDYPDAWEVRYEEDTGGVLFVNSRPGDTSALSISPLVMKGGAGPLQELKSAAERVGVNLDPGSLRLEERGGTVRAVGEGDRPGAEVIGSRFRFWVLRHQALTLFVTQLGPGAAMEGTRRAADEVLESLDFPEVMPPTIDEFRARVMEILAAEYPGFHPTAEGQWAIQLTNEAGEPMGTVGLENLYRDCLLRSESAGAIIREYLDQLVESLQEVGDYDDFQRLRGRLLPMLKPEDWIESLPSLASTEFAAGVRLCFAVDSPTRVAYVTREMLNTWDVPLERVQEIAQDNFARKGPVEMMTLRDDDQSIVALIVNAQDGYDATRLALPAVREAFAEELGDEYLVGIPNRDFLIAFSERDSQTRDGIIRQVKHDFQRMNHPITATIYRARPDRLEATDL